jgi:hypothetical protein
MLSLKDLGCENIMDVPTSPEKLPKVAEGFRGCHSSYYDILFESSGVEIVPEVVHQVGETVNPRVKLLVTNSYTPCCAAAARVLCCNNCIKHIMFIIV